MYAPKYILFCSFRNQDPRSQVKFYQLASRCVLRAFTSLGSEGTIENNTKLSPLHLSHKATFKLRSLCEIQKSKVLADVATWWNATLIMLRSLVDLKQYVQDARCSITFNLRDLDQSKNDWETLANAIDVLQPFEQ